MSTRNDGPASRFWLTLGLLCTLAVPAAAADRDDSYGYLRMVEGAATLVQAGSSEDRGVRTPAEVNQPVLVGDRLEVPSRSHVEVVLADRNLLRIDGGSELVLEHLAASPDARDRATVVRLIEGNFQLVVTDDSLGEELPRVETPNATVYVQDFGTYRITTDQERWSEVVVRKGKAEVVTDRGSQIVRADEQVYVEGDRWASAGVEPAGSYDSLERWARNLDQDLLADVRYVDDNLRYHAAPLARHGSWITYEGRPYWRPRVAAGWRPYWQGRWGWTPSGVTWISYEPWGWVPYHYGTWDYVPAYGWVWQPGRRFAPAWVYWYWGPSYVGWCPTGYYTRYYGSRHHGFRFGVYGWAGGDWGGFNHWTFISSNYFRGYRQGYRDGFRDGSRDRWRDHWNVQRYAVPIDQMRGRTPLERGIITTDTRPIPPDTWDDPRTAVRVLRDHPTGRRGGPGGGDLPDVTPFVARKPELPPAVVRTVVDDRDGNQLDGTPLRPRTLGPRQPDSPSSPRVAREVPRPQTEGERPSVRVMTGNRPDPDTREGSRSPRVSRPVPEDGGGERPLGERPTVRTTPRVGRPAPGDDGGSPRPNGTIRTVPGDRGGDQTRGGESERPTVRSTPRVSPPRVGRPQPDDDGGAPRPNGTVRSVPGDREGNQIRGDRPERPSVRSTPRVSRPEPDEDGGAPRPGRTIRVAPREDDRPEPRSRSTEPPERPSIRRPDPEAVRPSYRDRGGENRRPEPSEQPRYERPEPRVMAPRTYERPERPEPSPSSRDRGGYERREAPPERSAPPQRSTRSAEPERSRGQAVDRSGGGRGSGESSSGGRSSRRRRD